MVYSFHLLRFDTGRLYSSCGISAPIFKYIYKQPISNEKKRDNEQKLTLDIFNRKIENGN